MDEAWRCQLRIYLIDEHAALARADALFQPLNSVLDRHDAVMVSQLDAFQSYINAAERDDPLALWTKATLANPARRAKHARTFALRIAGQELYGSPAADALEAELKPLVGGGVVTSLTRHDANPAHNLPIPEEYRS